MIYPILQVDKFNCVICVVELMNAAGSRTIADWLSRESTVGQGGLRFQMARLTTPVFTKVRFLLSRGFGSHGKTRDIARDPRCSETLSEEILGLILLWAGDLCAAATSAKGPTNPWYSRVITLNPSETLSGEMLGIML